MRGILSNRSINRTDHKGPALTDFVMLVNRGIKTNTFLVDTLYYSIESQYMEFLDFIPVVGSNSPYSGLAVLHMTDSNYVLDESTLLTFTGYRMVPSKAVTSKLLPQYNETMAVRNPKGEFTATATYTDAGGGFATQNPTQTYMILNGTGAYAYAKYVTIYFDNVNKKREVRVYSYNP
jgi:hypothetical protein